MFFYKPQEAKVSAIFLKSANNRFFRAANIRKLQNLIHNPLFNENQMLKILKNHFLNGILFLTFLIIRA